MIKTWWRCIKEVFLTSPFLFLLQIFITILPMGVLSGWIISSEQNLIDAVQNFLINSKSMDFVLKTMIIYISLLVSKAIFSSYLYEIISNNLFYNFHEKFSNKIVKKKLRLNYHY